MIISSEGEGVLHLIYVVLFTHARLRVPCSNNIVSSLPRLATTMRSIFRTPLRRGCDSISGKFRTATRPSCKDSGRAPKGSLARCLDVRSGEFSGETPRKRSCTEVNTRTCTRTWKRVADKSETISSNCEREKVRVNTEDCSLVKPHE